MKKRIITLLAVVALLVVCAAFTAQADAPSVTTDLVCPCATCADARAAGTTTTNNATWTKITASSKTIATGGHYYIDEDMSTASLAVSGKTVVLVIDGATLTTTSTRGMNSTAAGTLHLIGNNGAKWEVTASGAQGGIAQMGAASTATAVSMNFYGDLTIQRRAESTGSVTGYGLIKNTTGTIHVHDYGTAQGLASDTDPTFYGIDTAAASSSDSSNANIFWNQSGTPAKAVIIDAGTFYCGDSGYGAIHAGSNTTVTINGGTFIGAGASNIIYNTNVLTINGGTFTGGTGRVIYTSNTTTINGGTFTGGTGVAINVTTAGTLNIHGGEFSSANNNVVYSSGAVVMDGGYITGTTASARVYLNKGTMLLNGDATVLDPNSEYTGNICITPDSKLHIAKTWTGKTSFKMRNADGSITAANPGSTNIGSYSSTVAPTFEDDYWVRCVVVADDGTVSFNTTANDSGFSYNTGCVLYAESPATENPRVNAWEYTLMPYRCQIVRKNSTTWIVDYNTAVNDVINESNIYIKVWATNRNFSIPANKTVYIDLNGKNYTYTATINDGAKLYVFDSAAEVGGVGHTIKTKTNEAQPITQFGGMTYVTKTTDGVAKVYPVELKISQVALRPTNVMASMYYIASFNAHADAGVTGGVALTLNPNASKTEMDNTYMYTPAQAITGLVEEANSVLVEGIVESTDSADDVKAYAAMPIYAKAYIQVGDAIAFVESNTNHSLSSLIAAVELAAPDHAIVKAMAEYDWYKALKA